MVLLKFPPRSHLFNQFAGTAASCLLCLSVGMTFGITAVLLPSLKEDESFPYDKDYISWIASVTPLTMIIGCLASGSLVDILGRKKCHLILTIPILAGWILLGSSQNSVMLLVARIISGMSNGAVRPISVTFIGEISEPHYRGMLLFAPSAAANIGVIISHMTSKYVHWRTNIYLCCLPLILAWFAFMIVEESPLWLISRGRREDGEAVFKWYRGDDDKAQTELKASVDKYNNEQEESFGRKETISLMLSKSFLKPLLTILFLFMLVQYCGVNTISFYAQDILASTFGDSSDAFMLMIFIDLLRILGSVFMFAFGKFIPRKKGFIIFAFGTILMLVILVTFLYLNPVGMKWIPITSLVLYIGLASPVVSLSWSFVGEIFPGRLRGIGSAASAATSYFLLFISVQLTPTVIDNYGVEAMYASFAVVTLICASILAVVLPETHGLSLHDIEQKLHSDKNTRNNAIAA